MKFSRLLWNEILNKQLEEDTTDRKMENWRTQKIKLVSTSP